MRVIEAVLGQAYSKSSHVHFVFSWKLNEETRKHFERFERVVKENGGQSLELGSIANKVAMGEWIVPEMVPRSGFRSVFIR
jgi:hypothetical protein